MSRSPEKVERFTDQGQKKQVTTQKRLVYLKLFDLISTQFITVVNQMRGLLSAITAIQNAKSAGAAEQVEWVGRGEPNPCRRLGAVYQKRPDGLQVCSVRVERDVLQSRRTKLNRKCVSSKNKIELQIEGKKLKKQKCRRERMQVWNNLGSSILAEAHMPPQSLKDHA